MGTEAAYPQPAGRRRLAIVLAVWAAAVVLLPAQTNPRIAPRDHLAITVWGVKEFSARYLVGADGTIEFPEIGRVKVAGLTAREAGDLLARTLREARIVISPQVTVELEPAPNRRVTVNGAVRSQGVLSFAGELTLLEALVRAGGRLPEAADEVLIYRPAQASAAAGEAADQAQMIEINARALEDGALERNVVLQDGDVVIVRRAQAVTITGYVRSVGAYTIQAGMNVEQALALAGGIDPVRGSDRRIEITRKIDGKPVTLRNVQKTDEVKPGDIIRVGRRIV